MRFIKLSRALERDAAFNSTGDGRSHAQPGPRNCAAVWRE
jgi:hypothetical protein